MIRKVEWSRDAIDDIKNQAAYIAQDSYAAAICVAKALQEIGEKLGAFSCVFREIWARVSRDLGHAFHAILGSHFADAGKLADGFMESGLIGSVKRFRDVGPSSEAFS